MVILERLLDAGTDINAHPDDGSTALDPAHPMIVVTRLWKGSLRQGLFEVPTASTTNTTVIDKTLLLAPWGFMQHYFQSS